MIAVKREQRPRRLMNLIDNVKAGDELAVLAQSTILDYRRARVFFSSLAALA